MDLLVQIDTDMAFFSTPDVIADAMEGGDIMLVKHGFPAHLRHLEVRGRFNAGVQAYRRSANTDDALEWWSQRCAKWCFDRVEAGRYADQGYLSELARKFEGVTVCRHPGVNLAPWNWMTRHYTFNDERLLVDCVSWLFFILPASIQWEEGVTRPGRLNTE
ncbi:MAG: hypothetical protein J6386_15700 [Candidatus Synoicihabitans palmerolidicus]|nr:hypothetical protein [Candidatus Synoicihabitans palmerolidicus]